MVKKNFIMLAFLLAFLSVYFLSVFYSVAAAAYPTSLTLNNTYTAQMNTSIMSVAGDSIGVVGVLMVMLALCFIISLCSGAIMGRGME